MRRSFFALVVAGFLAAFLSNPPATSHATPRAGEDKPKEVKLPEPTVGIHAAFDKSTVTVGDKVRLTELVPTSTEIVVGVVSHRVHLVSQYDRESGELRNLDPASYRKTQPKGIFDDLPEDRRAFHGWEFNVENPREKGIEFEFTASRIGVFLVVAQWWPRGTDKRIQSQPVILSVRPPTDNKGKPIIKPEHLLEK